jgi:hypothetical protein
MTGSVSQPSTAVAIPVLAGNIEASQAINISGGQLITGGSRSSSVMIWTLLEEFPHASEAAHVLEIVKLPGQLPGVITSENEITHTGAQLSVAEAVPVFAGSVGDPQSRLMFDGQLITGAELSLMVMV